MKHHDLTARQLHEIARAADADLRTVTAIALGAPVVGDQAERIVAAARQLGVQLPIVRGATDPGLPCRPE